MLDGMKHSIIRIAIIVGIIALVGAGVWWFTRGAPEISDIPSADESITPLASVSSPAIAYGSVPDGWKTYASPSFGFSVEYPSNWIVGSCGAQCIGWAPSSATDGQLAVGISKSTTTLDDVLTDAKAFLAAQETVKLGSVTWLKLTLQHPVTGAVITSYFTARGSSVYEFGTATDDTDILNVYGTMLSSFKFLK